LERTGFTVLEAEDGLEALEVYHRESSRLDAIVLDLSMPGREVFDVLHRADRNLPVLFTSGSDAAGALDGTKAVRFLQKPYRSGALSDELSQLISVGSDTAPPPPKPRP
jgi:CheY-like chemotaxis protein